VAVSGKFIDSIRIRNPKGDALEEYYKWQFIFALIHSGLYAKDYIGVEVISQKATKQLLLSNWMEPSSTIRHGSSATMTMAAPPDTRLEWLNTHLLAVIEFKRDDKEIEKVFTGQVKPAMREKDRAPLTSLGCITTVSVFISFIAAMGFFSGTTKPDQKSDESKVGDLSLHLPDPYSYIPSFDDLRNRVHRPATIDRSRRNYKSLTSSPQLPPFQLQTALSSPTYLWTKLARPSSAAIKSL